MDPKDSLIVASPGKFTEPPSLAATYHSYCNVPMVVSAGRLSWLPLPVASKDSKGEGPFSVYVVRFGKLKVAPPSAPRLASDTVVAPLASSMVPAPDADSTPPVMDNGPLRVELLLTLNAPLTMD